MSDNSCAAPPVRRSLDRILRQIFLDELADKVGRLFVPIAWRSNEQEEESGSSSTRNDQDDDGCVSPFLPEPRDGRPIIWSATVTGEDEHLSPPAQARSSLPEQAHSSLPPEQALSSPGEQASSSPGEKATSGSHLGVAANSSLLEPALLSPPEKEDWIRFFTEDPTEDDDVFENGLEDHASWRPPLLLTETPGKTLRATETLWCNCGSGRSASCRARYDSWGRRGNAEDLVVTRSSGAYVIYELPLFSPLPTAAATADDQTAFSDSVTRWNNRRLPMFLVS